MYKLNSYFEEIISLMFIDSNKILHKNQSIEAFTMFILLL